MQVVYLGYKENRELRKIIALEYTREDTNTFLMTVSGILNNPFAYGVVSENLISVVNTIIIDTLVRFVKNSDPLSLVTGMQNSTLGLMFEVGYRHYSELITEQFAFIQQSPETQKEVISALSSYVNWVYLNNKEAIDAAILSLFEVIYSNLSSTNIKQHRVTFIENDRPAIILIGDTYAGNNANCAYS